MPRKLIVLSCLLTVATLLSISTTNPHPVRAQTDISGSTDWEYPGAQGSWNGRSQVFTSGMFWTDDDFKLVLGFYAARAGLNTQGAARIVDKSGSGVAVSLDGTIMVRQEKDLNTAVITKRQEHQTISAHITREAQENGRTSILLVREEHTARKLPTPVTIRDRVTGLIKDVRQWESPGAEPFSFSASNDNAAINYRSPEALAKVLGFYADKLGAAPAPGFFAASSGLIADADHVIAGVRKSDLQTALFLKQTPESLYAVLASRLTGDEQSHFTLMSIKEGAPSSSQPPDEQALGDWEPKGGRLQKATVSGARRVATYTTQESFKSVADAYAMLLGTTFPEDVENRSGISSLQGGFLFRGHRPGIQTLVVFKRMDKYSLFLHLSHGVDESETEVTVVLQGR